MIKQATITALVLLITCFCYNIAALMKISHYG